MTGPFCTNLIDYYWNSLFPLHRDNWKTLFTQIWQTERKQFGRSFRPVGTCRRYSSSLKSISDTHPLSVSLSMSQWLGLGIMAVGVWAWTEKDTFNNLSRLTNVALDPAFILILVGEYQYFPLSLSPSNSAFFSVSLSFTPRLVWRVIAISSVDELNFMKSRAAVNPNYIYTTR